MFSRSIFAAIVLTLGISVLSVIPVVAAQPSAVTLSMDRDLVSGSDTWSSTGAITDDGTFTADPEFFAGQSTTLHGRRMTVGANGTLTLLFNVRLMATPDPDVFDVVGSWTLLEGTGAYAGAHGGGSVAETFDAAAGSVTGEWTGFIVTGP